ncbi:hypothetical protein ES702_00202 [subsurface metagenome]
MSQSWDVEGDDDGGDAGGEGGAKGVGIFVGVGEETGGGGDCVKVDGSGCLSGVLDECEVELCQGDV